MSDKEAKDATPVEFVRLNVGDSCGDMSLLTGLPRRASAVAGCDNTVLLRIEQEDFMDVLAQYQNIRFDILNLVAERLKETESIDQHIGEKRH